MRLPEVTNFLVGKFLDDLKEEWIEVSLLSAYGRWSTAYELWCNLIQSITED